VRRRGIRKQVKSGKIQEIFEIRKDEHGNRVITGHRNFNDEDKKERAVKGGK